MIGFFIAYCSRLIEKYVHIPAVKSLKKSRCYHSKSSLFAGSRGDDPAALCSHRTEWEKEIVQQQSLLFADYHLRQLQRDFPTSPLEQPREAFNRLALRQPVGENWCVLRCTHGSGKHDRAGSGYGHQHNIEKQGLIPGHFTEQHRYCTQHEK